MRQHFIYFVALLLLIMVSLFLLVSAIKSVDKLHRFDCVVEFRPEVTLVWGVWNWTIPCPYNNYCLPDPEKCRSPMMPNTQIFCNCHRDGESLFIGSGGITGPWFLVLVIGMVGIVGFIVGTMYVAEQVSQSRD